MKDWIEIERLYHRAVQLSTAKREAFLQDPEQCDPAHLADIRTLLANRDEADELLETPAIEQVAAFFGEAAKEGEPTPGESRHPDDPDAPWPGRTFRQYRIERKLGQGGMGEVFLARDSVLDRQVALKFLTDELRLDSLARKRFLREARTAAGLDHPYICHVNEVAETESGHDFIVMEYVEGRTLKDRLTDATPSLTEALQIATEITEALQEAHSQGIIHRDLKPANIMLTRGHVKVMDFGLAKRILPREGFRQDVSSGITLEGGTAGTLLYMSPEQVQAGEVDHRSDIFSFGALLYEVLTGAHPFERRSAWETAAAIVNEDPPPLPPKIPATLQRTVLKMLAKKPQERFQTAAQVRAELHRSIASLGSVSALVRKAFLRISWRRVLPWALIPAASALTALLTLRFAATGEEAVGPSLLRSEIVLPNNERMAHWFRHGLALSPDGRYLAFVSGNPKPTEYWRPERARIYIRRLDQWQASPVPGAENGFQPFFSPDSQWLGFWRWEPDRQRYLLKKVGVEGQDAATLCETDLPYGASWGQDGIVFAEGEGGLFEVAASGGAPQRLTSLDEGRSEVSHRLPQVLPDRRGVLFTALERVNPVWERSRTLFFSPRTGQSKQLLEGGSDARYLPSGHLVYAAQGRLMAVPFSLDRIEVTGPPVQVLEGVNHSIHTASRWQELGAAQFAVSASGLLAFAPGGVFPERTAAVVIADRQGREELLDIEPRSYSRVRMSPDGRYLALPHWYHSGGIWLHDLQRGISRRQTFDERRAIVSWGPEAGMLTLLADRTGFLVKRADSGPGALERFPPDSRAEGQGDPACWTPDGQWLVFVSFPGTPDIWMVSRDGKSKPFQATRFWEAEPACSPDGRWLAYVSDESGRYQVYLQKFPQGSTPIQISTKGGWAPAWRPDRSEIYYRFDRGFFSVKLTWTGDDVTVGQPVELFEGDYQNATPVRSYDVAPDGRFLLVKPTDRETWDRQYDEYFPDRIRLEQNWLAELKRIVPVAR